MNKGQNKKKLPQVKVSESVDHLRIPIGTTIVKFGITSKRSRFRKKVFQPERGVDND